MASRRTVALLRTFHSHASSEYHIGRSCLPCLPCLPCRQAIQAQTLTDRLPVANQNIRQISSSAVRQKKSSASSKSSRKSPEVGSPKVDRHVPDNKATLNRDREVDPYDYSVLEEGISSAIARLKDELAKTKDAGRVTPDMIEAFDVELNVKNPKEKGASAHHQKARLGDIASVVPKGGRMLQVFAAEESHIKAITAAIAASGQSLNPEQDKNNPLLILIPVPPATAETRAQAAAEAKKCFDKASLDVRNARGDAQKRFRKMELEKLVIKDELRKAHTGMENVARKGQDEVKKVYDNALKALQQ